MRDPFSYEAVRKHRWRGHKAGDHAECDSRACPQAQYAQAEHQRLIEARALLDEIKAHKLNPADYFEDLPHILDELDGFDAELTIVDKLKAQSDLMLRQLPDVDPHTGFPLFNLGTLRGKSEQRVKRANPKAEAVRPQ